MEISKIVYFSLGSNLGDRLSNLESALKEIKKRIGKIEACSSVYNTEAIGFETNNDFLNICITCNTKLQPFEVLKEIQGIENLLGRVRKKTERYSSRTIDIDIIFYDNIVLESANLQIPHPEYHQRLFVLAPLVEIAPTMKDPRNNLNLTDILLSQNLKQTILKSDFVICY